MPAVPPITMRPMALSADGRTNQTCLSAGATGKPVGTFMLSDVYEHLDKWLEKLDPPAGGATFGWDWRRAPQDSLDELEAKIDELLAKSELAKAQGAKRVTLAGHSYGGVLMRLFINDETRSRKVARMLNVGVPMWGSIKPFFPLVFGIEGIGMGALDMFVENEDLKDTMRNFPGAYHLLAGDNFGQWLTVDGADARPGGREGLPAVPGRQRRAVRGRAARPTPRGSTAGSTTTGGSTCARWSGSACSPRTRST